MKCIHWDIENLPLLTVPAMFKRSKSKMSPDTQSEHCTMRFYDTLSYSFLKYWLYFATVIDFMTCFYFTFCFYSFSYIFQLQINIQLSFPMQLIFGVLKAFGCIASWTQTIFCPHFSLYSSLRSIWTWVFQYASSTNMVKLWITSRDPQEKRGTLLKLNFLFL